MLGASNALTCSRPGCDRPFYGTSGLGDTAEPLCKEHFLEPESPDTFWCGVCSSCGVEFPSPNPFEGDGLCLKCRNTTRREA